MTKKIIAGLILGILFLSAASFYILKMQKKTVVERANTSTKQVFVTPSPSAATKTEVGSVSDKNDTATLKMEIDTTNLDSIDSDLNSLDKSANSL